MRIAWRRREPPTSGAGQWTERGRHTGPAPATRIRAVSSIRRCAAPRSRCTWISFTSVTTRDDTLSVVLAEERDSTTARDRAMVFDCAIDRLDMAQTVARCQTIVEQGTFVQQVSINAAKLVALRHDADLREVVNRCGLVNADGQSVVWASRLLGDPLPERVAGIDLMHALIAMAERENYGIYILGARPAVLETAVLTRREAHSCLRIVGYRDGYFSDEQSPEVASAIRASGAQILFVAMSSPRKEHWLG